MTLISTRLFSEPYGSTGNIGDNFRRLLGAPSIDILQTVIRESLQNVADAAKLGAAPRIEIRLRRLSENQQHILRNKFLGELPSESDSSKRISDFLNSQNPIVLEICDFQTTGLGGPTRPDRVPIGTTRTDFIDFLRNIGSPRDTEQGGGTYGFGKVALYKASRCSTIIVDTLPNDSGSDGRRLIGCHVGHSFGVPRDGLIKRFTGRHWWGIPDPQDSVVDPVVGQDASALAEALGFPARTENETGTSIMILDFDCEENSLEDIGNRIVEALLWNFWPRMIKTTPHTRRFDCRVEVNGAPVAIPFPEEFPGLELFAKALTALRTGKGSEVHPISSDRPAKVLGHFAVEKGLRAPRRRLVCEEDTLFPETNRHIALMRPVELVVKYLEGAALPDERLEWAGVFVCSEEHSVERAFADSEPPAHDDWVPGNLPKGNAKTYVNVAMTRLKQRASEMGTIPGEKGGGEMAGPPLARVAGRLGSALEGVNGDGAGRVKRGNGHSAAKTQKARVTRPLFERLELVEGNKVAVFTAEVVQGLHGSADSVRFEALIALDGTASPGENVSIFGPTVLSIRHLESGTAINGCQYDLDGKGGKFEVRVKMPPDYAVTLTAELGGE